MGSSIRLASEVETIGRACVLTAVIPSMDVPANLLEIHPPQDEVGLRKVVGRGRLPLVIGAVPCVVCQK